MTKLIRHILYVYLLIFAAAQARAFEPDFYAPASRLASGRWVKISVSESGLHSIPASTLRSWGFNNPSRVRVYGYGGRRIDDELSAEKYVDDLPETMSALTDDGSIVFYAAGPDAWEPSTQNYYHGYLNPYSTVGYYFLGESDDERLTLTTAKAGSTNPASTAQARVHHEKETTQATTSGPLFVGEDFARTKSQTFNIATPGRVDGSLVWMECSFMHFHVGASATMTFSVDGTTLSSGSDMISATTDNHYVHGSLSTLRKTFTPASTDRFSLGMVYRPTLSTATAWLDYLSFAYNIKLELPANGSLAFWSGSSQLSLAAPEGCVVWDVTNPTAVAAVATSRANNRLEWTVTADGMRSYAAWRPGAKLPSPTLTETIAPQDLHGSTQPVDMVIITPSQLIDAAKRIADLHRSVDGMEVAVVDQSKIYNEFSSGTCDVGGLRKYLKFVYDRSAAAGRPLRYVLLMGRATLDQRRLTSTARYDYHTTPWWVVREPRLSMTDNDGYGTDDFIAMLDDGSGNSKGLDRLSVAVGRIPALNATDANEIVDKLYQYVNKSRRSGWKNRMLVLADDEDNGVHLNQAENMIANIEATEQAQNIIDKIYIDAYDKVGNTYPEARREMYRLLDDGVAWWIFTGHANDHSWTAEEMLTYNDLNNMYLRNIPMILASTCDFLRWDGVDISGGEIMYKERYGGCINMVSATRPVYITDNGMFLNAFGRQAMSRDDDGRLVSSGEAYRRAKNDIRSSNGNISSNTNRLRFVFMGDPALRLVTPSNIVEITSINGVEPVGNNQPTIAALSNSVVEGRIVRPDGSIMSDFNGVVSVDIFDADYSVTTLAHGEGVESIYDRHGDKLFSGSTTVANGTFSLRASMPSQIAENFRPATLSAYAYATNSNDEAAGVCRQFYVYGFDEAVAVDTIAPSINSIWLNHSSFRNGDVVNSSPLLVATVEDNIGLNLSMAGVGHQMSVTIDDFNSYADVASFYTPSPDGSPSGSIAYPLDGLADGPHTLKLRVFDTSGNTASASIDFNVSSKAQPSVFEVFTDANPASTAASFYVRHDRPDAIMGVTVTVYNLMGQPVWSGSARGMSDNDVSAPVTWNLCDSAGRRVARGIYLYRASITEDGLTYQSATQRIAVTAP